MSAVPSPKPTRLPGGLTTDPPYGPLANSGLGNPAFYHQDFDDFDWSPTVSGAWTQTLDGGTAANLAGDGGFILLTPVATSTDFVSIQRPAANWLLPQVASAGKKLFFLARLQLSSLTANMIAGLCDITTTPFSGISDGVYFHHASGGAVLNLLTVSGSTTQTWVIPTAAYTLAAATSIDVAFYIDRNGNINVFVGSQLVGWLPQSGTGAVNSAGVPTLPVLGPCLQVASGWTVSTANLSPTLAVQTEASAANTLRSDFILVQKER